jgi:hypothetical protein
MFTGFRRIGILSILVKMVSNIHLNGHFGQTAQLLEPESLATSFAPFPARGHFPNMTQHCNWETERLRQMTADEKVRVAQTLWREVWNAAAAGVRARHPDWSEPQVQDGVRELMRGASGS